MRSKLSVIIPVYNEKRTLSEILRQVKSVSFPKEIIVVDDGSNDGTAEWLKGLADPEGVADLRAFLREFLIPVVADGLEQRELVDRVHQRLLRDQVDVI